MEPSVTYQLPENHSEWVLDGLRTYADHCREAGQNDYADMLSQLRLNLAAAHKHAFARLVEREVDLAEVLDSIPVRSLVRRLALTTRGGVQYVQVLNMRGEYTGLPVLTTMEAIKGYLGRRLGAQGFDV